MMRIGGRPYEYESEFARRYFADGEKTGIRLGNRDAVRNSVFVVLDARAISVPDDVRDRITACAEIEQLSLWLPRAAVVENADDLFVDQRRAGNGMRARSSAMTRSPVKYFSASARWASKVR